MSLGLELTDVGITYRSRRRNQRDTIAVADLSFRVSPGEILALLGPSGCGKSSLLRAIAGFEPLAAGRISWDGDDLAKVPAYRRNFGLMFQDGVLFEHLSVGRNVGYGLRGLPRHHRHDRVARLLSEVGLDGYQDRSVSALSGGQRQRVALARSLAPAPRLLLLDEPLSSLDRQLRNELVGMLSEALRSAGTTAVYVTHDQTEALQIADTIAVMSHGRLRQVGSSTGLVQDPIDDEVASSFDN